MDQCTRLYMNLEVYLVLFNDRPRIYCFTSLCFFSTLYGMYAGCCQPLLLLEAALEGSIGIG